MAHPYNSGSAVKIFLKFCRIKGANRYVEISLVVFEEKFNLGQFDILGSFFIVWLGMVEIELGHCYYWILKQSGHDFSGEHLCNGYCMDIMWCLCVEVKIQQKVIWFCKASLRICYESLFECKGPWLLKTDSSVF